MSITRHITLVALFGCLVVSTGLADGGSTELRISKVRIDFGKKAGRDVLLLSAAFDPSLLSPTFGPDEGALAVTIGPETVISYRGKIRVDGDSGRPPGSFARRLDRGSEPAGKFLHPLELPG